MKWVLLLVLFFSFGYVLHAQKSGTGKVASDLDYYGYGAPHDVGVDEKMELPRVSDVSSGALDVGLRRVATKLDRVYKSNFYRGICYFILSLCIVVGCGWKAKQLIYGEKELGDLVSWGMMRFIVGFTCFFFVSAHAPGILTKWINTVSRHTTGLLTLGKSDIPPHAHVRLWKAINENERWLKAAVEALGPSLQSHLKKIDSWAIAFEGKGTSKGKDTEEEIRSLSVVFLKGFPGLTVYLDKRLGTPIMTSEYLFAGSLENFLVPRPYADFGDGYGLYAGTGESFKSIGTFKVRPLLVNFEEEGIRLGKAAVELAGLAVEADTFLDMEPFEKALFEYRLLTAAARKTFLVDYIAWHLNFMGMYYGNPDVGDEVSTEATIARTKRNVHRGYEAVVRDLEASMMKLKMKQEAGEGGSLVMYVLVPMALAIVGFYTVISIYSIPVLFLLLSGLWFLPEEWELSNGLKNSFNWIVVLFLLPIFSTIVVALAFGFVDAVKAMVMSEYIRPFSAAATGVATATVMPSGLGIIGGVMKFGAAATSASLASMEADMNIFVWVSWIMAFIFIVGMPKIVASLVKGANGFADSMIQKAQIGAVMGGGMVALGAQSSARGRPGAAGGQGDSGSDGANAGMFKKIAGGIGKRFGIGGGDLAGKIQV